MTLTASRLAAQPASAPSSSSTLDPEEATRAYLAKVPPDKKERSDAYFEGGYWLTLWSFLYGAGLTWLLLGRRWSGAMRDRAVRLTTRRPLQNAAYWVQYLTVTTALTFPLTWYMGFYREHQYGLATQTIGPWLVDQAKGFGLGLVFGSLFLMMLYGVLRRAQRTWWLWGAAVTIAFLAMTAVVLPVFINPIFNTYVPLDDEKVRDPILRMARANGVAADTVYEMDASRQTTRISANVSGLLGTERITLNDNLLNRCTLPEIEAVMAHEIGHYVLNHVYEMLLFFSVVVVVGFAWARWGFGYACTRWGPRWNIGGVADPAGWPLLLFLLSVYFFAATPLLNTYIRSNEYEADLFGLNAARQPDGFAEVSLKLGDYRKLEPGSLEEWIFFDHPSGRTRILAAMTWKAQNQARGSGVPGL
jgi:STE24 endopeptidase